MSQTGGTLLTSSQAAALLGVSVRTVERMAKRHDLAVAQTLPGGRRLFAAQVVQEKAMERVLAETTDEARKAG